MKSGDSASIHSTGQVERWRAHLLVEPEVAPALHRHLRRRCAAPRARADDGEALDGLVDRRLERNPLAAAQALVGGDHELARRRRGCGRAATPPRSRRRPPSARRRCARRRASSRRARGSSAGRCATRSPLVDAVGEQHVGDAADLVLQLAIGDVPVLTRLVAGPDDRGLVAAGREVAVDAVVAGVQPPAAVPGEVDLAQVGVEDRAAAGGTRSGSRPASARTPPDRRARVGTAGGTPRASGCGLWRRARRAAGS